MILKIKCIGSPLYLKQYSNYRKFGKFKEISREMQTPIIPIPRRRSCACIFLSVKSVLHLFLC